LIGFAPFFSRVALVAVLLIHLLYLFDFVLGSFQAEFGAVLLFLLLDYIDFVLFVSRVGVDVGLLCYSLSFVLKLKQSAE
jgi:hypothetical protein